MSTPALWVVMSMEKGFFTVHGWARLADYAYLHTNEETERFIAEQPNDLLLPVLYDRRTIHTDVRVIEHKTNGGAAHDIEHLNSVARAAIRDLRLDKHQTTVVQIVGERSAATCRTSTWTNSRTVPLQEWVRSPSASSLADLTARWQPSMLNSRSSDGDRCNCDLHARTDDCFLAPRAEERAYA
jgi:hypothetical protein